MSIHESLVTARRWAGALIFAGAVFSFSAAGGAETRIAGVVGSDDKTVARLTIQMAALEMRGGNVTTTDPGGNGVFSAGYDGEGGAACVNHKQSMHCLGIGLPLGGGQ